MMCGQDCASKAMILLMILIFSGTVILGVLQLLLNIAVWDKELNNSRINKLHLRHILLGILCSEMVCMLSYERVENIKAEGIGFFAANEWILLSIISSCLLMACITDLKYCMVYDYVWWIGGIAASLWLAFSGSGKVWDVVLFGLLQELFFSKMYGRADCHAFLVCSLAEGGLGMSLREYLLHMLLAFLLLMVVQAERRNIGKGGNLKKKVPFLPYITIAFWMNLLLNNLNKEFVGYLVV